jgi:diguanylate cyclase (GGDEF)-like protein
VAAQGAPPISPLRRERTQQANQPDGRAAADLAWLVIACSILSALAMKFRVIDQVTDWSNAFKTFNLDGIMALFVLVPLAATLFSYRRYKDAMAVRSELARLSLHDSLTGLPNRLYLADWLKNDMHSARKANLKVAVLFIDLDRFKQVNDTGGHARGDEVLALVAERLRGVVAAEGRVGTLGQPVLARYAGDEFVMLFPGIAHPGEANQIAARAIESLAAPLGDPVELGASVGIALAPRDANDLPGLIRAADAAMYRAKANGRGQVCFYHPRLDDQPSTVLRMRA